MDNANVIGILMEGYGMYRLIGSKVVENSEGFIFGSNDRWSLKYSDERGVATVCVDYSWPYATIVPTTMRRWTKEMSPVTLSDDDINVITDRIKIGWSYFSDKDLLTDSRPTEKSAAPPRELYWPLYNGKRRPISIP
jgi:hypothetical protein